MPRPTSRKKSELSKAVLDLRTLLGESQQAFSNRLGVALNTIARYETNSQPSGDMLLKLAAVAEQHQATLLRQAFQAAYVEQAKEPGFHLLAVARQGLPAAGILHEWLEGGDELQLAHQFLVVLGAVRSKDPKAVKKAVDGMKELARECSTDNPPVGDSKLRAYRTAISRGVK